MPTLVVKTGSLAGKRIEVTSEITLGRENADVVLPDEETSRRHAVIRPENGQAVIEDLGSTNGTFVNGTRIEGATQLSGGETIKLGETTFEVEVDDDDDGKTQIAPRPKELADTMVRDIPVAAEGAPAAPEAAPAGNADYDVADLNLADAGQARIEWADAQMPVLATIRERFEKEKPLEGITIAACLHVTTETANLIRTLMAGGADAALCASNPLSTQDETAAALVDRYGAKVFAIHGEDTETYYRHIDALADMGPQITMDDGADVISVIHTKRTDLIPGIIGGTEETTTGVIRLKALEEEGKLAFPIVAVNEAQTKHLFDNRYGTGQSTLDGILRATNVLLAGRVFVVFGYGWCGKGVAMRAKGAGSHVVVCEVDPVRALEAKMDGFEVLKGVDAAAKGDIFVSVTGGRDAMSKEHFEAMKDGAIIANAGHFDVEINIGDLEALAADKHEARPFVSQYSMKDGRRVNLLADGRLVNLASAEGHPAAVMDMSFANQALSAEYMVKHGAELEKKVYVVPPEIDKEIARLKLESLGVEIDTLTEQQDTYLHSWDQGT
ncbi:MAG: adenosylhomocysteinase [Solirubrobacteraceae bacterium]|nr:adenosylhomocysteinase [Solirubrobacteraceae bacterium]